MENASDVGGMKGIVFNLYDGTGSFQQWKEEMTLVLLANDMYCFIEGTDTGDKKTSDYRKQRAFALIALNLSRSCRDCLRHLESRDPKQAWEAVLARFERTSAAAKMAVLDTLLNLRCGESMLDYVSKFNECVGRLESMEEKLGKDLKVAIFLRGLPKKCRYLVDSIKVRERFPEIEEVINLALMEARYERNEFAEEVHMAERPRCAHANHEPSKRWVVHPELGPVCHNCGRKGHIKRDCPDGKGGAMESKRMTATADYAKQESDLETSLVEMDQYADIFVNRPPIVL